MMPAILQRDPGTNPASGDILINVRGVSSLREAGHASYMPTPNPQRSESPTDDEDPDVATVLIVEDERDLADLYTMFLQDEYDVRTAYTGDEALELLDDDIDVALLDRRLPNWSGDQLLKVIRERGIECQVAMVSAVDPDFDIADLAIDDYVTKSVSRDDLRSVVEELLLRADSDIDQQELLSLVSRKIVLENEKQPAELDASDEYANLVRKIEGAKDRLDLDPAKIGTNKHRPDSCSQCELRWDISVGNATGFLNLGAYVWKCTQCGSIEKVPDPANRRVT